MPHLIIEHGNAIVTPEDRRAALDLAVHCGEISGVMKRDDIKVRLHAFEDFLAADGCESFIHVTVKLLAGRTPEQKERLATLIRDQFDHRFPTVGSISVDIRDMDPDAYKKRLLP
ncbi:hypothetical protein PXK00_17505 [Phaeobacter sp. QD34_3]|uniref:5-carboxymethyl-2-hydroxymuconate Delta-isomerase n=1 Tax=unclassified Phaeobacter TaxID=2621772 RepID=UPI00237F4451|nr:MULTISPECIES: hypothetical protein [unclassified Phaeobacter]MDE4134912.1 hypothetical protein [Phaeobacter sp. QD34_3]MDE4138542.1 hypothetical protein [Phaeobacter sp. QD34_24]